MNQDEDTLERRADDERWRRLALGAGIDVNDDESLVTWRAIYVAFGDEALRRHKRIGMSKTQRVQAGLDWLFSWKKYPFIGTIAGILWTSGALDPLLRAFRTLVDSIIGSGIH